MRPTSVIATYSSPYSCRALASGVSVTLQEAAILLKGEIMLGRVWPEKWNFSLPYQ